MNDTRTELFAALAEWKFPMSQVDMYLLVAAYGKNAHRVMPFDPDGQVTSAEVSAAHDELLSEIKFS